MKISPEAAYEEIMAAVYDVVDAARPDPMAEYPIEIEKKIAVIHNMVRQALDLPSIE
jgi:hypothetical protein